MSGLVNEIKGLARIICDDGCDSGCDAPCDPSRLTLSRSDVAPSTLGQV